MGWQRARQPGQKAERVDSILNAARSLFDEKELLEISMRDVAERSGLGKASLYHYFKTKEEVFISLYGAELQDWLVDVEARFSRLRKPTPERVAKSLTDALRERTRFCRLAVMFSAVLEHNLAADFVRDFKLSLLPPIGRFAELLREVLPGVSMASIEDFLFQHHAIVAGLWPLANPAPVVESVLQSPELQVFRIDFYALFERTMKQLLKSANAGP
ncbi:MAG: TetR family transcriptional regulator [Planctomycetota bacterium]